MDQQPFLHQWTTHDEETQIENNIAELNNNNEEHNTNGNNTKRCWISLQLTFSPKCEVQNYGVEMKLEPDCAEQDHPFEVTTAVVSYDTGVKKAEPIETCSIHRMETRKRKKSHFAQVSYF